MFHCSIVLGALLIAADDEFGGWQAGAPRPDIRPTFSFDPTGSRVGDGAWTITATEFGQHGWFAKSLPVEGGKSYNFRVHRRATGVKTPRRQVFARISWTDADGKPVLADPPPGDNRPNREGYPPLAYAEHPGDGDFRPNGEATIAGVYRAPSRARHATLELHLQGDAGSTTVWSEVKFHRVPDRPSRKIKVAAIHHRPTGGRTVVEKCGGYAPLIAEAARQGAELAVLGETVTAVGDGRPLQDIAEPIPGPSTAYFSSLAKEHKVDLVVGLYERDGPQVFNVAVLLAADGTYVGKYRKVCLPRDELAKGVTPGSEYPVFDMRYGKVGMMVCYDGFFPEVARELAKNGAEVIAWPVWGCNPLLAQARACENHIFLASSTYTDANAQWTRTAVYGRDGMPLAAAERWNSVVVAEIDLAGRHFWRNNLGDFKAENYRHRPPVASEAGM